MTFSLNAVNVNVESYQKKMDLFHLDFSQTFSFCQKGQLFRVHDFIILHWYLIGKHGNLGLGVEKNAHILAYQILSKSIINQRLSGTYWNLHFVFYWFPLRFTLDSVLYIIFHMTTSISRNLSHRRLIK